jgi:hypothetical protein
MIRNMQARILKGSRLLLILLLAIPAVAQNPSIRLDGQTFRVSGLADTAAYPAERLGEIFAVFVDVPDVPALSGEYKIENSDVVFISRYPLGPGMKYRAELRLPSKEPLIRVFETASVDETPTTSVEHVYPSTNVLPENQLKFYIQFSAPMSRGEAYSRIHLLDSSENTVEDAFLELPEELWDREARRLTIFFDPGRIKTGLVPNVEMGTALQAGNSYTLVIDRDWRDGENRRLKDRFTKVFRVGPPDKTFLNLADFKVTPPRASSQEVLTVDFPEPMDHALLERQLAVLDAAGNIVAGSIQISRDETRWQFLPSSAWRSGRYALRVATNVADLAGNMIGRPFEVDVFDKVDATLSQETQSIPFTIN